MRAARPILDRHEVTIDGDESRAVVVISWKGAEHEGHSVGASTPGARPRLIGEAVLRALESVLGDGSRFDLAAVATTDLGASRIAIAQVQAEGMDGTFVGSAVMAENDPDEAAARAVLDAINRHVGQRL